MKTVTRPLAGALCRLIGETYGRKVTCLYTAMDAPLGRAVGNRLEVEEAWELLRGDGPADVREVVLELAAALLALSDLGVDEARGQGARRTRPRRGAGGRMVRALGAACRADGSAGRVPPPRVRPGRGRPRRLGERGRRARRGRRRPAGRRRARPRRRRGRPGGGRRARRPARRAGGRRRRARPRVLAAPRGARRRRGAAARRFAIADQAPAARPARDRACAAAGRPDRPGRTGPAP